MKIMVIFCHLKMIVIFTKNFAIKHVFFFILFIFDGETSLGAAGQCVGCVEYLLIYC